MADLLDAHAVAGASKACGNVEGAVKAARKKHAASVADADLRLEAAKKAAGGSAVEELAAAVRHAELLAVAEAELEHGLRDAVAAGKNLTGPALQTAVDDAVAACAGPSKPDWVTRTLREADAAPQRQETLAAAIAATGAVGEKAAGEARKEAYEAVAGELAKVVETWNGTDTPFLRKDPVEIATIGCEPDQVLDILPSLPRKARNALFSRLVRTAPSQFFWTLEASTSSQDFKYLVEPLQLNPDTKLVRTKKVNQHSQSGRLGVSLFERGWLWTVGYSHDWTWKQSPAAQFCIPRGDAGGLTCATVSPNAPADAESDVFDAQAKRQFSPSFALAAELFYEEADSVTNPHLLLYFLPADGKLRGGVDLSYVDGSPKSSDDGFAARLFVGIPFSL